MAHDLATTDSRTAMMYTGEVPWHGLGTRLGEPATAKEAIQAAGLDYLAELRSIRTVDGTPIPSRRAVVRSDTCDVLGVVGTSYVPVQNHQAFGFLDCVVADGSLRYHTAGALGKGERVWMLAKLPDDIRVKNSDDITEKFLLLSNSHDGSSSLRVHFTPIRVVCANTLAIAASGGRGQGVSIIHKGDLAAKVRQAQEVLGLAQRFYDDVESQINRLACHYPSLRQLEEYFRQVYPDSPEYPFSDCSWQEFGNRGDSVPWRADVGRPAELRGIGGAGRGVAGGECAAAGAAGGTGSATASGASSGGAVSTARITEEARG